MRTAQYRRQLRLGSREERFSAAESSVGAAETDMEEGGGEVQGGKKGGGEAEVKKGGGGGGRQKLSPHSHNLPGGGPRRVRCRLCPASALYQ